MSDKQFTGAMQHTFKEHQVEGRPEREPDFTVNIRPEGLSITVSIWYMEDRVELTTFNTDHGFQPASTELYDIDYFTRLMTEDIRHYSDHSAHYFNLHNPQKATLELYEALGFKHLWIWNYRGPVGTDSMEQRDYLCSVRQLMDGDILEVVKDHDYRPADSETFYKVNQYSLEEYKERFDGYAASDVSPPPFDLALQMREALFGEKGLVKDDLTLEWEHHYKDYPPQHCKIWISNKYNAVSLTYDHDQGEQKRSMTIEEFVEQLKEGQFMNSDVLKSLVEDKERMKLVLGMLHDDELNQIYG